MLIDINYDRSQLEAAIRLCEQIERRIQNPAPLMEDIGEVMVAGVDRSFQREQTPDGIKWAMTQRKEKNPSAKILRDKGKLSQSIGTKVEGNKVIVGTQIKYAETHQNGYSGERKASTRAAGYKVKKDGTLVRSRMTRADFAEEIRVKAHQVNIPARPFMGFSPEVKAKIIKLVIEYVRGGNR